MMTKLMAGAIAAGSIIALTGCGSATNASQQKSPAIPSPAASPIPPVQKAPRDVAAMARRPCELLTPQQAASFRLDLPPEQEDGLFGTQQCTWLSKNREYTTVRSVYVSMFTNNLTLEAVYGRRQGLPFFEMANISGYPAIVSRTNASLPGCDIDVKPAERQSVSIIYRAIEFKNNPQQACEVGKQVAAAVVMNFPLKS
ncbi:MAG TPA: DUF3558 domain-containing protein [Pseudonocardiaceae bacterium]|nr:DUF3558 domain-containing protein [Pseudonocardiaceae bacterium]